MRRLDHGADVPVLENESPRLASSPEGSINYLSAQIVGQNHLVGERHPKERVDRAQLTFRHFLPQQT
jgi:hypothetical protein